MREMDEEIERWEQEDVKLEMSETLWEFYFYFEYMGSNFRVAAFFIYLFIIFYDDV
jgi:hypothetical protein